MLFRQAPVSYIVTWMSQCHLSTTTPTGDGENVTPPSGGGYAPVNIQDVFFSATDGDDVVTFSNDSDILFPAATESWGTVTHVVLYWDGGMETGTWDPAVPAAFAALGNPLAVTPGRRVRFPAGSLRFLWPLE